VDAQRTRYKLLSRFQTRLDRSHKHTVDQIDGSANFTVWTNRSFELDFRCTFYRHVKHRLVLCGQVHQLFRNAVDKNHQRTAGKMLKMSRHDRACSEKVHARWNSHGPYSSPSQPNRTQCHGAASGNHFWCERCFVSMTQRNLRQRHRCAAKGQHHGVCD